MSVNGSGGQQFNATRLLKGARSQDRDTDKYVC